MADRLTFTILGCGSSGGVPRIGGLWGECDPSNPKNIRSRCSMLVTREGEGGTTRVLIDAGPDLRAQLLATGVGALDGVVFTHAHADHVHGIDDLRQVVFLTRQRLDVWADGPTQDALLARFAYVFVQPPGSAYPPILNLHGIDGAFVVEGAGGPLPFMPFRVNHGSIDALGFRIFDLAYLPDVAEMKDEAWPVLEGLDCWVVDALRRTPHPTHSHLAKTLAWIDRAAPRRAVITNMHIDLDYDDVMRETPDHVVAAHDGMSISYEI